MIFSSRFLNLVFIAAISLTPLYQAFAADDKTDALVDEIIGFVQPQIHYSKRPLSIYHYFKTPTELKITDVQIAVGNDQEVLFAHASGRVNYTYEFLLKQNSQISRTSSNGQGSGAVPGFFASFDPVESVQYGGEGLYDKNWALLEIELPINFSYLEIGVSASEIGSSMYEYSFNDKIQKDLKEYGCDEKNAKSSTLFFIAPQNGVCAKLLHATLKKLNIDAILYPFGRAYTSLCPNEPRAAFLFTGLDALSKSKFKSFNILSIKNRTVVKDLTRVSALVQLSDKTHYNHKMAVSRSWPMISRMSPLLATAWAQDHFLGCSSEPDEIIDTTKFIFFEAK